MHTKGMQLRGPKHGWSNPNFFYIYIYCWPQTRNWKHLSPGYLSYIKIIMSKVAKSDIWGWSNSICKVESTPHCFSMCEITVELKWEVSIDSSRAPDFNSKWLPVFFKRGNYGQSNEANKYGKTHLGTENHVTPPHVCVYFQLRQVP